MSGWKKPMAMNVIIANTLISSGIPKGSPLSMPLNAWLFALIRMFAGNDIIVPIMRTGRYVVRISGEAFKGTDIKSVTLPESMLGIGSRAFKDCTSLKSINIPPQVFYIGEGAFEGCTSLTSVAFEDDYVWYIEDVETNERTRIDVTNDREIATKLAGEYATYRLVKE